MGRLLESLSKSHNIDMLKNAEETTTDNNEKYDQEVNDARNAVLEAFDKNKNSVNSDEWIVNCRNRVFKTEFGPRYDSVPNVFKTNDISVYGVTGMDQIADSVNCGYARSKEGKVKGGHENEVFWSIGGDKLNYIDERPILETSVDAVKDGQIGALSLDDLTAVWAFDGESGKRENKLNTIKDIKKVYG